MGWSNVKKVIIITSIHSSIPSSIQLPLKVCFIQHICGWVGWADWMWRKFSAMIGCEKANLLWCPFIQHWPSPPPRQGVCFLLVWVVEARMDGRTGWSDRMWRKFIIVTSYYRVVTSVRPTISLKHANYYLFRNLTFLFLFFFKNLAGLCSFLHPGIATITGSWLGIFLFAICHELVPTCGKG
jgi:hypothetical protein